MTAGEMGGIRGIAVDDSGRVYLADTQRKTIHVFSPDGQFLQNLGRSGSGPGEFGHIFDMKIRGDKLFAFDPNLFQINFYSLESMSFDHAQGLFVQDWAENQNISRASPIRFYDWGDNNLLIGFSQILGTEIYYYLVHNSNYTTSIISDPILIQKQDRETELIVPFGDGELPITPSYARKSLLSVSTDRHIFSTWTDQFLIKEYDSTGTYLRSLYYPYNKPPLTQADLDSLTSSYGQLEPDIQRSLNENPPPATWPALYDMKMDDENRLWVSTVVGDPTVTEWWILERMGELIARFTWPRDEPIEVIKNGYMYTRETDEETGMQQIFKYRIEMGGGNGL